MKNQGFTLLELLISLVILSTLVVLSSRSIQQALFSKAKIQTQIDDMSQVRDALRVIERDINLAYHDRDLETEFREEIKKIQKDAVKKSPQQGGATPQGSPTPPPVAFPGPTVEQAPDPEEQLRKANRINPETHFEGKEESLDFVTLNSSRLGEGLIQSDLLKIGYAVKSCSRVGGKQESTKCLMRRSSPWVEGDVTKGGKEIVLLENISEFKLRYFGKGKQDWVSSWSSKGEDASAKGQFPGSVEVSLTMELGNTDKKRKISMQIVAPIRFPNNKEKTSSGGNGQFGAPPPSGGGI